jgi:hypothetical protein
MALGRQVSDKLALIVEVVSDKAETALRKLGDDTAKVGDQSEATGSKFSGLFDKFTTKFPAAGRAASKFGIDAGTAGSMAATAAATAATAVGAFAVKSVQAYQEVAGQILQFQRVSGTSAEEASRWVEVAGDYGVSSDEMGAAIGRLAKQASAAPEKLAALGVQVAKNADGSTNLEETMLRAAEAFRTQTDDAKKAELGMALFGKSWQNLVPLLVKGSDGLAKSLGEVSDAKILDDEDLRQAEEFRLAIDDLKGVSEDLMIQVGRGLVPALKELTVAAKDAAGPLEAITKPIGGLSGLVQAVSRSFTDALNPVKAWKRNLDELRGVTDEATKRTEAFNNEADRSAERAGENAKLNAVLGASMEDVAEAAKAQAEADKLLAERQKLVEESAKKAASALDERRDATKRALDQSIASATPILAERNANRELAAAAADVAKKTDEAAKAKFKDAEKNGEVVVAQDGLISKLEDVAGAYVLAAGKSASTTEGAQLYVNKLRELRDQYGANLGPAIAIYDELIARIDETIRKQSAVAGVGTPDRPYQRPGGPGTFAFDGAKGGDGSFGTPSFGGGGGPVYNVSFYGVVDQNSARIVMDAIALYERTNGKGWRSA